MKPAVRLLLERARRAPAAHAVNGTGFWFDVH